ncbi:MAG TPA: hypothetical protein VIS55_17135 [Pseudomonadales bacterium]
MTRWIAVLLMLLWCRPALGGDIGGTWKNDADPVWIEVVHDDGVATGTVVRNDRNPAAAGRLLLKDLKPGDEANVWRGQVFAVRLGEFRDAQVRLTGDDRMEILVKVGFMSRTVTWTRADQAVGAE